MVPKLVNWFKTNQESMEKDINEILKVNYFKNRISIVKKNQRQLNKMIKRMIKNKKKKN